METNKYITPEVTVIEVVLEGILCESLQEIPGEW